jgi:hypothetical protein
VNRLGERQKRQSPVGLLLIALLIAIHSLLVHYSILLHDGNHLANITLLVQRLFYLAKVSRVTRQYNFCFVKSLCLQGLFVRICCWPQSSTKSRDTNGYHT